MAVECGKCGRTFAHVNGRNAHHCGKGEAPRAVDPSPSAEPAPPFVAELAPAPAMPPAIAEVPQYVPRMPNLPMPPDEERPERPPVDEFAAPAGWAHPAKPEPEPERPAVPPHDAGHASPPAPRDAPPVREVPAEVVPAPSSLPPASGVKVVDILDTLTDRVFAYEGGSLTDKEKALLAQVLKKEWTGSKGTIAVLAAIYGPRLLDHPTLGPRILAWMQRAEDASVALQAQAEAAQMQQAARAAHARAAEVERQRPAAAEVEPAPQARADAGTAALGAALANRGGAARPARGGRW